MGWLWPFRVWLHRMFGGVLWCFGTRILAAAPLGAVGGRVGSPHGLGLFWMFCYLYFMASIVFSPQFVLSWFSCEIGPDRVVLILVGVDEH